MRRTIVVAVFALLVGVGWSAVAGAASIDDVATALRSDPVYVDPAAERALSGSPSPARSVTSSGRPAHRSMLLSCPPGPLTLLVVMLRSWPVSWPRFCSVIKRTIAVLAGDSLRAGSSELPARAGGRAGG